MTLAGGAARGDDAAAAAVPLRKGRPRDERIDVEITSAALDLLATEGFDRFTVEAVAARAGVAKTTVYRRFPTRNDLIVGALLRLNDEIPPPPVAGPVRDRLILVLQGIRRRTTESVRGRILMQVMSEGQRDPDLAALVHQRVLAPRRQVLRGIIADGIASGELRPDVEIDTVVPVLVGPMLYLGMWGSAEVTSGVTVESVVDLVLTGLATPDDCRSPR
jgi:AcrR family transcriptional regulator